MNKAYSILLIISQLVLLAGCDKYLSIEDPQDISNEIALSSDENIKSVLNGAYSQFATSSIYGGNILRNSELLAGNGEILWVGSYPDPNDILNKSMDATNSDVNDQWCVSYAVINTVNNILSALQVVNEADRDRVESEALFLRGLIYFDLIRFYAQQYKFGIPNTQVGVPLVLTPTQEINSDSYVQRNTVDEVYNQVIANLTAASVKLPEDNGVYASRGAANALLARVYLQKGDYDKARDASNAVIQSGVYSLLTIYAEVFNNDNNASEDIFATQITSQDRVSAMTEFFSVAEYGGRDGDIEMLPGHLDLYAPGDKRKDLFFLGNGAMRSGKWNNKFGVVNLIRLAEMYLIRAECNIRLGTETGATPLEDYNTIHTRAGLTAATSVTLEDILFERRLELSFEGFRIHDVRRLHENVVSYPYDDPKLVFPIPARELEANPALKDEQNPGY
jgi:starch-binding outer membrane protein, SusD/RagB family